MIHNDGILILTGNQVASLLQGRELDIIETVRKAYETHGAGASSLPHSTFLRFPDDDRNRIIALPAFLGGDFQLAGIKWVSSFPENIKRGMDRASAALILNSKVTGRPEAFIESSIISAKRTAASAALAAQRLIREGAAPCVGLVGTGLINFETLRFLLAGLKSIERLSIFDLDVNRSKWFKRKCNELNGEIEINIAPDINELLSASSVISFATTAISPHIFDIKACRPGATILHVSLRDLSPQVILDCDNIVDDVDHVCRAQTSVHLAEQMVGNRDFIRCALSDILSGRAGARRDDQSIAVFSPFGLGVLDIAVADLALRLNRKYNYGVVINSFAPQPWGYSEE